MSTYIECKGERITIPASCSFSHSNAWNTIEKRSTDASGTVQNIVYMQKKGMQPNTYQISFVLTQSQVADEIYDVILRFETLIGQQVNLVYSNYHIQNLVVQDGSFTLDTDSITGLRTLSISMNLKESIVITQSTVEKVNVHLK